MPGEGEHSATLTLLLDDYSPLVQENAMPEDDIAVPWMVRLTSVGQAQRRFIVVDQDRALNRTVA